LFTPHPGPLPEGEREKNLERCGFSSLLRGEGRVRGFLPFTPAGFSH